MDDVSSITSQPGPYARHGKITGRSWIWLAVGFALPFLLSGALLAVAIALLLWTLFMYISVVVGLTPP